MGMMCLKLRLRRSFLESNLSYDSCFSEKLGEVQKSWRVPCTIYRDLCLSNPYFRKSNLPQDRGAFTKEGQKESLGSTMAVDHVTALSLYTLAHVSATAGFL